MAVREWARGIVELASREAIRGIVGFGAELLVPAGEPRDCPLVECPAIECHYPPALPAVAPGQEHYFLLYLVVVGSWLTAFALGWACSQLQSRPRRVAPALRAPPVDERYLFNAGALR